MAILPYGIFKILRKIYRLNAERKLRKLYASEPENYCPVCKKNSYFIPVANLFNYQPIKQCAYCGSLGRHRLLHIFLNKKMNLFERTRKILHVSAEPCLERWLKERFKKNYITADLDNPYAMEKMDITDIHYPDGSFDAVICSHVLEHIPDDKKAMGEFYRVLKKDGWAVLMVPIANADKTYEDFSINTDAGRLVAFGQDNHVRIYGRDYIERLKCAGFNVNIIKAEELATGNEINSMSLNEELSEEIYYCSK
jgi:SAM-dependent methyltransferase